GVVLVDLGVEAAQEVDGLKVLAAAELVGNPLTFLARVIEVEHGGDGIHAQAIHVILVQPEEGTAEQEANGLAPAIVEDEALPVGVKTLLGVGVLVEVCTVEVT